MSSLPPDHPFRRHSANLRSISAGLTQAERVHKAAIRIADAAATDFMARMHQLMIGLLAEAQLRKIISDPDGFNDKERKLLAQERTQIDRWLRAVELAFRRHYAVPVHLEIDVSTTAAAIPGQFTAITRLLCDDLEPIIDDRNKLAHAQWQWVLNSKETAFIGAAASPLNYLASYRRGLIIRNLAELIHVLVVSEPTFHRDYNLRYNCISTVHSIMDGPDYPEFESFLRSRHRKPVA